MRRADDDPAAEAPCAGHHDLFDSRRIEGTWAGRLMGGPITPRGLGQLKRAEERRGA